MALFGTSDEYVPLLTAFYQSEIDIKNPVGGELDVLMFRYTFGLPHDNAFWSGAKTVEAGKQLEKIASYHGLITRMMDAAADDTLPATDDLEQFNRLIREVLTTPQLVPTGTLLNSAFYPPEKAGRINQLFFLTPSFRENRFEQNAVGKAGLVVRYPTPDKETGLESDATIFLAEILTDFVKGFDRGAFKRCEECASPFAATRAGTRFCSRVCAERNGLRKRRQAKKNALVEIK